MRAIPLPAFEQARRDLNPQPPVLETGALPVELRTYDNPSVFILHSFIYPPLLRSSTPSILQWPGAESNHRHHDFQSRALPTELPGPKKIRPAFRRRAARRGGCTPGLLEAPLDGPPCRARPRIRHRPSAGVLRIGPEHRRLP